MTAPILVALAAAVASASAQQLTLQEAIAEAEAHGPAIEAANAEREAAKARTIQARSAGLPSATISGTIGVGRLDPGGFFGLQAADVAPRSLEVIIEQPLFTGGRVSAAIARARAGETAAGAARDSARADLAAQVAEAFGNQLVAQEELNIYRALVTTTAELLRQAEERFKAGDAPLTDVSQASARLAEARAQLAAAQGSILTTRARLARLTGQNPVALVPLPPPPSVPADLDLAILAARDANPQVKQASAALDAALAAERGARAERLPTIGAFAGASTIRDQFFPGYRADSATIGVRANWQIFDSGRVRGKVAEADATVRAAQARLGDVHAEIREAVTGAYAEIESSIIVEQAASQQRTAAAEAARSVREEVKVGEKPQIDLLNAEREAAAAAVAALKAHAGRVTAAYRLNALLGRY